MLFNGTLGEPGEVLLGVFCMLATGAQHISLDPSLGGITEVSHLLIWVYCMANTCKSYYASAIPASANTNLRTRVGTRKHLIEDFPPILLGI